MTLHTRTIFATRKRRVLLLSGIGLLALCCVAVTLWLNKSEENTLRHPCRGYVSAKQVKSVLPGEDDLTEEVDKRFPRHGDMVDAISYCMLTHDKDPRFSVRVAFPQGFRPARDDELDLDFGNETAIYNPEFGNIGTRIHCSNMPRKNNYPMLNVDVRTAALRGKDARTHRKLFRNLAEISGQVTHKVAREYNCPHRDELPDKPLLAGAH